MKDLKSQHKANDPRHHHLATEHERPRGYAVTNPQQKNHCAGGGIFVHVGQNDVQAPRCLAESQLATQNSRVYSPHAMSEPEYGPSIDNRVYKLVPIRDAEGQRHYSDSEGASAPAFHNAMMPHEYCPPSPAPEDPMMDCDVIDLVSDAAMHRSRLTANSIYRWGRGGVAVRFFPWDWKVAGSDLTLTTV